VKYLKDATLDPTMPHRYFDAAISKRCKELQLLLHPDKGGDAKAFQLVTKATEDLLKNPNKFRTEACPQREDRGRDAPGGVVHRPPGRLMQKTHEETLQLLLDQLNAHLPPMGVATKCNASKISNRLANHRSFWLVCDLNVADAKIVFKERVNGLTAGLKWGEKMRHEPPMRTTWKRALDGAWEKISNPAGVEVLEYQAYQALTEALSRKQVLTPEEWADVSTLIGGDGVPTRIDLQPHHVVQVEGGWRSPAFDFPSFRAAMIECTFVVGKWELSATVPFELATLRRPSNGPFYVPQLAEATAKWAFDNRVFVDNMLAELRGQVAEAQAKKEELAKQVCEASGLRYTAPKTKPPKYLADFEKWRESFTFARTGKRKRDEGETSAAGETSAVGSSTGELHACLE